MTSTRTVVMTGGTSGLGSVAADRIRGAGEVRLLLGGRREVHQGSGVLPLDLTDLGSVRTFATTVEEQAGERGIDALVLNAGVILPDAAHRTESGIETTFAVNHLAHYVLIRLLLPALADGGRIVLTTSGAHDPGTKAGLMPPRHACADLLAHPDRDPGIDPLTRRAGQHAYTASKVCAVLTARVLAHHEVVRARGIQVTAYCPGQVFGTGLARSLTAPRRVAWSVLGSPVGWLPRRLSGTLNSPTTAGAALADLTVGASRPPAGRTYAALRRGGLTWPDPSALGSDAGLADALWRDSARLVGLPEG